MPGPDPSRWEADTPPQSSTTVLNPVDIEHAIGRLGNRIADGVKVCTDRERDYVNADREYDAAYAREFLKHKGPQTEKRYAAELATTEDRARRDTAYVLYRYADRQAKAIELQLRAYQSIGASVRAMYQVAGRGES